MLVNRRSTRAHTILNIAHNALFMHGGLLLLVATRFGRGPFKNSAEEDQAANGGYQGCHLSNYSMADDKYR